MYLPWILGRGGCRAIYSNSYFKKLKRLLAQQNSAPASGMGFDYGIYYLIPQNISIFKYVAWWRDGNKEKGYTKSRKSYPYLSRNGFFSPIHSIKLNVLVLHFVHLSWGLKAFILWCVCQRISNTALAWMAHTVMGHNYKYMWSPAWTSST